MSCDAEAYLGEGDEPSGQTMPLQVSASWTGAGALVSHKGVTQTRGDGWRTLERTNFKQRPAMAMVRIVGPDGVLFEGPVSNDDMGSRVSLVIASESMMRFGPVPQP